MVLTTDIPYLAPYTFIAIVTKVLPLVCGKSYLSVSSLGDPHVTTIQTSSLGDPLNHCYTWLYLSPLCIPTLPGYTYPQGRTWDHSYLPTGKDLGPEKPTPLKRTLGPEIPTPPGLWTDQTCENITFQ